MENRYRGRVYRTVISGQDPACVIGSTPGSMAKLILVITLAALGLGALVLGFLRFAR